MVHLFSANRAVTELTLEAAASHFRRQGIEIEIMGLPSKDARETIFPDEYVAGACHRMEMTMTSPLMLDVLQFEQMLSCASLSEDGDEALRVHIIFRDAFEKSGPRDVAEVRRRADGMIATPSSPAGFISDR